ncbi:SDR family oxidoreductase [Aquirufa ecclesiirivi]|uniref:SDR family oxidoreductase n=1 Tax=Aquirufa ecclesiirivi TaxID=2715124 RepID=UPI0022A8B75E|nr:SDR family oxidoreductase [Aquirufa ecclesiirivi]MCZ2473317.1 SDR family oxidoreductase [Aquirufa ecclesiirivi]
MSQKPSILLTGGSGLLAVNWFYSKRNEYSVYLGLNERQIHPHGGHVLSLDFTSEAILMKQLEAIHPSVVIHTAGLTSVEKCESKPDLAYHINVELSSLVANATKRLGIPLVHISTDHLFEGNASMLSEEAPTQAINVYGQTKALAEKAVLQINPNALLIRTNFYGWGTSYRKSFSDHIIQALRDHQTLHLFDDVHYTPILAENLIQTVHDLLDKKAKGIYHVVSDDRISKYEFGVLLAEEFGLDKSLIHKSTLASQTNLVKRPADMSLSNRKVSELLGRNLGTVKQHIAQLHQQELDGKTQEIQLL